VVAPADNHVQLRIFETVVNGIAIKGSFAGNRVDLPETFELHAAGRTRVERETRKLEKVNEAFEEVESGKVEARLVFDFR
jgi:propanol-preferring alcohol dehydrogenase